MSALSPRGFASGLILCQDIVFWIFCGIILCSFELHSFLTFTNKEIPMRRKMLLKKLIRVSGLSYEVGVDPDYGVIYVKTRDYIGFCVASFKEHTVRCFAVAPRDRVRDRLERTGRTWRATKKMRKHFAYVASTYLRGSPTKNTAPIILERGMKDRRYPEEVWETQEKNVASKLPGVILPYKRIDDWRGDKLMYAIIPPILVPGARRKVTDEDVSAAFFWATAFAACFPRPTPQRTRGRTIFAPKQVSLPLY